MLIAFYRVHYRFAIISSGFLIISVDNRYNELRARAFAIIETAYYERLFIPANFIVTSLNVIYLLAYQAYPSVCSFNP